METKLMVTQKEIHELAKSKGWWPRPFGESIALLHSELSEALEEWRDGHGFDEIYYHKSFITGGCPGKPEGIPIEMADFAIRLMDLAESENYQIKADKIVDNYSVALTFPNFACELTGLHYATARLGQFKTIFHNDHCQWCWDALRAICSVYQIPLFRGINLKHSFNQTRDFRHGGKLA